MFLEGTELIRRPHSLSLFKDHICSTASLDVSAGGYF